MTGLDSHTPQGKDRVARPSAADAARRAMCLGSIDYRGVVEDRFQQARTGVLGSFLETMMEERHEEQQIRLHRRGLMSAFSPAESRLMTIPLGAWAAQDIIDADWTQEAGVALLWALGLIPKTPPYDRRYQTGKYEGVFKLHLPDVPQTPAFLASVALRSAPEIDDAHEIAELWHWRARMRELQDEQPDRVLPGDLSYAKIIALHAERALREGIIDRIIDDDFPTLGKAYAALSDDDYQTCRSIARERHHALNWLCGYAANWDDVRTDT